jgi:hypothetical protein
MVYLTHRERQLDEMILRYEGITPPKYQLWQSSHGFTGDDAMLAGGIAGLLISFRMKGLNSISVGKRLLGRLGAVSTGTWAGYLACPFLGLNMDQQKPSIQRSRYEEAVALRRLNDDPDFNKSLVHVPMLAERHWKRTVMAEQEAMSFASLTEEEKTVLRSLHGVQLAGCCQLQICDYYDKEWPPRGMEISTECITGAEERLYAQRSRMRCSNVQAIFARL